MPKLESDCAASNIVYISWAESCSRSDHTARELGGRSHLVYLPIFGSHPLTIPFKYLGQFLWTVWILLRERPSAVFVMSPPLFASIPAYAYKLVTGAPFVIDCHTAAYQHPRWRRLQWLQHFLGRKAATNIVTNEHLASLVRSHGGKATIVQDVPVVYQRTHYAALSDGFSVAVVCSFNADEPVANIFEAARLLPGIPFYVTGNTKFLNASLRSDIPQNMHLTGFLTDGEFGDLICRASVVMTLTTRDHTMLRGAWEAIYQETPVIVSNWPVLMSAFPQGAVFTDNTVSSIVDCVQQCQLRFSELKQAARQAKESRLAKWMNVRTALLNAAQQ